MPELEPCPFDTNGDGDCSHPRCDELHRAPISRAPTSVERAIYEALCASAALYFLDDSQREEVARVLARKPEFDIDRMLSAAHNALLGMSSWEPSRPPGGFIPRELAAARMAKTAVEAVLPHMAKYTLLDWVHRAFYFEVEVERLRALVGENEDIEGWGTVSREEAIRQANDFHEAFMRTSKALSRVATQREGLLEEVNAYKGRFERVAQGIRHVLDDLPLPVIADGGVEDVLGGTWLGHVKGCEFGNPEGWRCMPACTAGTPKKRQEERGDDRDDRSAERADGDH